MANHPYCFLSNQKEVQILASLHVICERIISIVEDPGAVSRAGEEARRKFSSTGGKVPGYHFQTVKRMLALDWAQKMLCIIVPSRRTASPEFFSWVRTKRLLSRHICPVRSPSFPNQKRRNYRWVDKRFGCYQQEQFNLHRENSVSDGSQCIVNNRTFKMQRRRESKKSISLTRQNNLFASTSRFFVHFFDVTARLPRENAQFHVSWRT